MSLPWSNIADVARCAQRAVQPAGVAANNLYSYYIRTYDPLPSWHEVCTWGRGGGRARSGPACGGAGPWGHLFPFSVSRFIAKTI